MACVGTGEVAPDIVASALSNPLHASILWGDVATALATGTVLLHRRDAT